MTKPVISAIAAMNMRRVIGADGSIPWHSAEDFKHFSEKTKGATVIMGRKTWDSLPKKPLPGRLNIVITRNPEGVTGDLNDALDRESVEDAIATALEVAPERPIWIIGGSEIYRQAFKLGLVDVVEMTLVHDVSPGDAWMPEFEDRFEVVSEEKVLDTNPKLTFYSFRRRPK